MAEFVGTFALPFIGGGAIIASKTVAGVGLLDVAKAHGTAQEIAAGVSAGQAFGLEAIATFFLVFVVLGTAVDPRSPKIGGLAIGFTIAADILVALLYDALFLRVRGEPDEPLDHGELTA